MPLGMETGLGPGDIVLDGDPSPLTERGTAIPIFRLMSIVTKRLPISATNELLFKFIWSSHCETLCVILQYLFIYSKVTDSKESNNSDGRIRA